MPSHPYGRLAVRLAAAGLATGTIALLSAVPAAGTPVPARPASPVLAIHAEPVAPPPAPSVVDAERQAGLVAAEDHRLNQVRAVAAVAPLQGAQFRSPYRLNTGSGYTLVLTQRSTPYTVADLLKLAPQTFVRQPDSSYLLTENVYLNSGAKLRLANPGGLTLRLASNSDGFISIVSFGGGLILGGTAQAPVTVTSWDTRTGKADTEVGDGRAYLRAIGGQFTMTYAKVSDLGFWSGRTGGVSLTGTDRPNTGSIVGPDPVTEQKPAVRPGSGDVLVQPSGPLDTPDSRFGVPSLSYISGEISHSTVTGNAFGVFVSSAVGITISDTIIQESRHDGLVLHRFVSGAIVERTVSKRNGGDGFILSRATQQVRIFGATAEGNAGNGYTLSGAPLAQGPSASGESIASYGSNAVSSSVARDNGRYGIEVIGGFDVGMQNNQIEGSDMGIVVRAGTERATITGNQLAGQRRQSIAVRDGVTAALITGNVITGVDSGIYLRDSVGEIRGNTVQDATNHGVSLVGRVGGTLVSYNVIAGVGPSALDIPRAEGRVTIKENQTFAWYDTSSFWVKFRHYASPMTMLWAAILLLIVLIGVKGATGARGGPRHPYADKLPLPRVGVRELTAARGRAQVPVIAR